VGRYENNGCSRTEASIVSPEGPVNVT